MRVQEPGTFVQVRKSNVQTIQPVRDALSVKQRLWHVARGERCMGIVERSYRSMVKVKPCVKVMTIEPAPNA